MDNEVNAVVGESKEEEARQRDPSYHVVYHGEAGIETHSFYTKRELSKHLKPVRPESLIGLYKGKKLHVAITNDYSIM